ncbi:HNH endonuclease [Oxalobacteraceae bacterium CAVE-383]|nr:HNH endonuclease [Oxalobacteraceae bacterium CAVE-383]
MRTCIYCQKEKPDGQFSLEHVIPQCLGGLCAPDEFKTRDVCAKCNNDLGLFVDASFEKSWFVSHQLQANARSLFDPLHPQALPLVCMGPCNLKVPGMLETEVCESWLGPFGEQIYWIRPHDERLYWYSGGNPRTTKSMASRAYFMFSINSTKDAALTLRSFDEAFAGRLVKKVMCTQVVGFDLVKIGFSKADPLDEERIKFLLDKCVQGPDIHISLGMNVDFDLRFVAKLAIGICHCLFGTESISKAYLNELHKTLWHTPDKEFPQINGRTAFGNGLDQKFSELVGLEGAIVLLITKVGDGTALNLNLGPRLNWTIKIAEHEDNFPGVQDRAIVIFKSIGKSIQMPIHEFFAFKIGQKIHPELQAAMEIVHASNDYFASLERL